MDLEELFKARRDTRHFTGETVPQSVLEKALLAGHTAPSVGLTDATRFYIIKSTEVKQEVKKLFEAYNHKANEKIENDAQKILYNSLKLEAILDAPVGLVVCYDRSVLNDFTIGTIASNDTIKFSAVCAVQNIWLSLTEQGYSMGWVSILNYYQFKELLNLPGEIEPLGYFCVGKPATDYEKQPMLQQLGWKNKTLNPSVTEIREIHKIGSVKQENDEHGIVRSDQLLKALKEKIDNKTKPVGALGALEQLAFQIGEVFQTTAPQINNPHLVVFAADHGIAQHGVSAYPQEVTRQMVNNFLEGGAAINVFCRQNGLSLQIVDSGVNYDFPSNALITDCKISRGTQSFLHGPAMSVSELDLCFYKGAEVVKTLSAKGCNTIGFGEMGIGNTSSASVLMHMLCDIPLKDCIGKGTGVNEEQFLNKLRILQTSAENYNGSRDMYHLMAYFGGFEILQIAGAILEARRRNMLILIDGFICTAAYLCASKINPAVRNSAIFCHKSDETGHDLLLDYLNADPLLNLNMRLGEGTGCALAFPIIKNAVAFLNEMASFESAAVSNKEL
ncbi:nicotinate-nucleotide--dimethylbenzimidazole phosphoribosyltransferase [Pedobacter sp. P351]|uniref:nicotinate-nucleotide--dimethylbenzimidazole phosphoribosyltransferase n=1 Tax=Pedobacter superstes TaxID=3133441 RepID=UPI0030B56403